VTPRVGVCDYGVGNLRSVERALATAGASVCVSADPVEIAACDGVILPGVGAFAAASAVLRERGLDGAVCAVALRGLPVLGVCLGHQLLFEHSDEGGGGQGLGLLPGAVTRLRAGGHKVPHMGWNRIRRIRESDLFAPEDDGAYVYFVHSYAAQPEKGDTVAVTEYGGEIAAAVQRGNVMGTQFHPEKSGFTGLRLYASFVRMCATRMSQTARAT
jgi:imidazole glycerol-phosphate synthase subunit HisH